MFVGLERVADQQGAGYGAQQRRLLPVDDAVDRNPVMAALADLVGDGAGQHLLDMADAEALAGAVDGGQEFAGGLGHVDAGRRSEEHTSELQSLMRISYAVFCLKKKTNITKI